MSSDPFASPDPPFDAPDTPLAGTAPPPKSAVKFTRAAALWVSLVLGFLILIVLLVFIAQNTASAEFAFLGWHWSLPLGVAILFAAVAGGLLTVAVGAVRIFQLRRAAKKNLRAGL
ncbi:LapA family protein [Mycolicibacterium sp.]|uniref:LapA family protein n=1 Tax=Mycolicibacterium sp. TaxID=2320850 RepID=UPI003D0C9C6B